MLQQLTIHPVQPCNEPAMSFGRLLQVNHTDAWWAALAFGSLLSLARCCWLQPHYLWLMTVQAEES